MSLMIKTGGIVIPRVSLDWWQTDSPRTLDKEGFRVQCPRNGRFESKNPHFPCGAL